MDTLGLRCLSPFQQEVLPQSRIYAHYSSSMAASRSGCSLSTGSSKTAMKVSWASVGGAGNVEQAESSQKKKDCCGSVS